MNLAFIIVSVFFVLFLPFFIAALCNSKKTIILISALISVTEAIVLVPLLIADLGISFPHFNITFLNNSIATWMFFINLFIVILHNHKKLFK